MLLFANTSPAPHVRAVAALLTVTAALAFSGDVAAASPAASAGVRHRVHRTTRAHAKARGKGHAKLHAALHAKAHARFHARRHAHLPALTTVAAVDAAAEAAAENAGAASLRGSHAAVDRAYDAAVREGLPFVHSNAELERRAGEGEYVALDRATATYRLKGVGSPYVRPATRDFVVGFADRYARECGGPLTVTSAMRPTSVHLRNSVEKSVHPTGMAVDLRAPRDGCHGWMRQALLDMESAGTIDATEEHHPAHFHVVVLRAP